MAKVTKELLEEARRRYPVGTKFWPAHLCQYASDAYSNQLHTVEGDPYINGDDNHSIFCKSDGGRGYMPIIWSYGAWADIIDQEKNQYQIF